MRSEDRTLIIGKPGRAGMTAAALIAGLLALLASVACGGGSTSGSGGGGASIRGTIAVGTSPNAIAVDSGANKIYVTDFGNPASTCSQSGADLETIDGTTQTTTSGSFGNSLPANPYSVAVNSATHAFYVTYEEYWHGFKNTNPCVRDGGFIDGHPIANFPRGADVNSTTGSIYVADLGDVSGLVYVWDGNWNRVATVPVGSGPIGLAVNATTNMIYVANSGSNNVSVIDGASNTVVATVTDSNAKAPVAIAVDATTNTIYVANSQSNNVTVIDGATNAVTATIPVGTSPSGVAVDSQTNFIYVANAGNSPAGDPGNVTVINGATNAPTTLTDPNAKNPSAVAVNSATNKIYVANSGSNNVTVINGAHD